MKNKKLKKVLKNKRLVIFTVLLVVLIVCIILLKGVFFPGGKSNYGNRLDGIKKIEFTKKDKNNVIEFISKNDNVKSSKMNIHGKIINVIFDVNENVSIDDSRKIASSSLEKFSDKVKGFYDIQFIITKSDEKGEEKKTTDSEGKEVTTVVKNFPIMGYKNANKGSIVW